MTKMPTMTQNVEVNLPHSSDLKTIFNTENPSVILEISDVGQYTMVTNDKRVSLFPLERLAYEAKLRFVTNSKTVFLIGGAPDIPYDEIIKVLNALNKVGITSVGLMTQRI